MRTLRYTLMTNTTKSKNVGKCPIFDDRPSIRTGFDHTKRRYARTGIMSTTIAMCRHLTMHAKRMKEKIIDRQSLKYVVRRRSKTKSSCVVGSLCAERIFRLVITVGDLCAQLNHSRVWFWNHLKLFQFFIHVFVFSYPR